MSPKKKIYVVEDEEDIHEVIVYALKREGFEVLVKHDGEEALTEIKQVLPDLILLDLMLPGMDGLEVCRQLQLGDKTRDIPIVIVTAKGEESDVVLGLGLGADDYVTKPFSPKELVARVKAVLRRGDNRAESQGERIKIDDVVIDAGRHEVLCEQVRIDLTATEFRLLHHLASHPGRVYTRDQLLNNVVSGDALVIDRNIDVHVRSVRKKLGAHRDLIETVRGVGYRLKDPRLHES